MPPCEPSVTFFGRSSMRCTSPTSIQAGRHQAPSNQRHPARKANVSTPELNSRPRLAVGCRLNEKGQQSRVLHMPERALRLNGPSLALIAELTHRCPLHCVYCSNPLEMGRRADELTTEVWSRVFREAAEAGVLQVDF